MRSRTAWAPRRWVYDVETGKPTAEIGLVLRLLQALALTMEVRRVDAAADDGGRAIDLDAHLARFRP
jgi:hypothetical protein